MEGGDVRFNLTIQRKPFFLYPGGVHSLSHWGERVNALYSPDASRSLTQLGNSAGYRFDMQAPLSDTMDSHRLVLWAQQKTAGLGEKLAQAIGHRYFEHGVPLADREMLCECAAALGLDAIVARAYLDSDAGYADVRASVEALHRTGVHSIPVFIFSAPGEPAYQRTVHGSANVDTFREVLREIGAHAAPSCTA